MQDDLGDRMKQYESQEAGRRFLPLLPVVARLDGKNFSKFTRGLKRPYDVRLSELMAETTTYLVKATNACVGYTQSDEISLAWYSSDWKSQIYFDGRVQKMVSVLAAECSVYFNRRLAHSLPERETACPVFDCRVWQLPTLEEAANTFLWRELDASKNSVSMAAQAHFSHTELMRKSGKEKVEMLFQKGVNWNDFPAFFKRGTFVQRRVVKAKLTPEDLVDLPEKHHARQDPDMEFERTEYRRIDMPPFGRVKNRAAVLFEGAEPVTAGEVPLPFGGSHAPDCPYRLKGECDCWRSDPTQNPELEGDEHGVGQD